MTRPAEPTEATQSVWHMGWECGYSHDAAVWTGEGYYACLGGADEDCRIVWGKDWDALLDEIEEQEVGE